MKLIPISDIHVDFLEARGGKHPLRADGIQALFPQIESDGEDQVVCACGDVGEGLLGCVYLQRLLSMYPKLHVVYVPGNHEFYSHNYDRLIEQFKLVNRTGERLHVLDGIYDVIAIVNDVAFVGGTLWTNFNNNDDSAKFAAGRSMNDFKAITSGFKNANLFSPARVVQEHHICRNNIKFGLTKVARQFEKRVVLTHHKPYLDEVQQDLVTFAYESDAINHVLADDDSIAPQYWFYGHTHKSDYKRFPTTNKIVEIVANPVGYPTEHHNPYRTECVLEI